MLERVPSEHNPLRTLFAKIWSVSGILAITGLLQFANATQIVQVQLPDISALETLQRTGLDVSNISSGGLAEVILMDDRDRAELNASGLRYFVSLQNAEQYFASRLQPGRDDMGGYPTFDEIVAEMNQLHEDFPDIVGEPFSIGQTLEGRELWVQAVSDNPADDEGEAEIYFGSAIHCREVITPLITLNVIRQLAEGYGNNDRITMLVDERKSYFTPVANPDGYVYNEESQPDGGGMWRKNRSNNDDGTIGVDLNRNWGDHWAYDDNGSSPDGADETYRGPEAFSEAETNAIREFANSRHLGVSIFFHAWGNLCLYPFGYEYLQAPDQSILAALSKRMISQNNYLPGTGWEVIYRTNGDSDDWFYGTDEHDPVMAYTFEVGLRTDSFWPPLDRVDPLVNENVENCLTAIEFCDRPARVLQPPQPHGVDARLHNGELRLTWNRVEDESNPAVSYRLFARLPGEPVVDDAPQDDQRWERVNFSLSQVERHSGTHSYRAALLQPMATMTLRAPIIAPDTLRAWVNYNLRNFRGHYAALEASEDGWSWTPLAGQHTANQVINNINLGPGLTGLSDGWRETWWSLGEFAGRTVKLRFRSYSMYIQGNNEFFYVDDISPLPSYEWTNMLAEGVEDTAWTTDEAMDDAAEYVIQALDSEGDYSFLSDPVRAHEGMPAFVLRPPAGWSMISFPVTPESGEIRNVFAPWLEAGILAIVKDGFGRFFLPDWDFDQIGRINPLAGYSIRMRQADTLVVEGEFTPFNTPVPLGLGWNMIAYLPQDPLDAEAAWENIADNLLVAKDYLGRFWLPSRNFNNLTPLQPGQGYLLKLNAADTLIYPNAQRGRLAGLVENPFSGEFTPPSPDNMSLLISLPEPISSGSIRLFDAEGNLSGLGTVSTSEWIGVAAWAEEKSGEAGFAEGEPITAIWRDMRGIERFLNVSPLEGETRYMTNGLAILDASFKTGILPESVTLSASPNPFNGQTNVKVSLPAVGRIKLDLYDNTGRLAARLAETDESPGDHYFPLDLAQLPAGLYICRLSFSSEESSHAASVKLLLLR